MEKQNNHKLSSFWFGFLLGGSLAGLTAFLFGTKQGRNTLKKILEMSENIEETVKLLLNEYSKEFKEKEEEIINQITNLTKKQQSRKTLNSTLQEVLNKINILSPETQKKVKRFFVKEGKTIEPKSS